MSRLVLALVNSLLFVGVLFNVSVIAELNCGKSSTCPGSSSDCNRSVVYGYPTPVCQDTSTGCCQYTKYMYAYSDVPGHSCTQPLCGQYSGDPPVNGIHTTGYHCSGGNPGMHQGSCVAP